MNLSEPGLLDLQGSTTAANMAALMCMGKPTVHCRPSGSLGRDLSPRTGARFGVLVCWAYRLGQRGGLPMWGGLPFPPVTPGGDGVTGCGAEGAPRRITGVPVNISVLRGRPLARGLAVTVAAACSALLTAGLTATSAARSE